MLGVGVRQIAEYVQRGMPRRSPREYCVEECQAWVAENVKTVAREPEDELGRAYWETYKCRERALMEELKRKQLAGELIEVDYVARHNERRIAHAKSLLEQIPDRMLGLLPKVVHAAAKKEFRRQADQLIEDVLFALSASSEAEDEDLEGDNGCRGTSVTVAPGSGGVAAPAEAAAGGVVPAKRKAARRDKQ